MGPLRIGVIGAGAVAERHVNALAGFGDVRVVAVADPVAERAVRLAERAGATPYEAYELLLERERLDAVYICVPPFAHGAPEQAVIEAGLPFFVEKPLAADLATARDVAARLEGSGLVTATGYHWRALDTFEQARTLLAERPAWLALGCWLDKVAPPPWWGHRDLSGGQTVEQATHVLDVLRVLVGEVVQVHAAGARVPREPPGSGDLSTGGSPVSQGTSDIDDVSTAMLRFAGGAVGSLTSTSLLTWHDRMGVRLIAESMTLELSETELVVRTDGDTARHPARVNAKTQTDRDFLEEVQGRGTRVRAPYAEALRTHRLACAIADSAARERPVQLEVTAHA